MGLFKCAAYLAAAGAASFVLGRAVPPAWFREPRGPFRCFPFEQEGRLYERAGVKRWQGKLPDMSRILPGALPPKRVGPDGARDLSEMVRETCVAELAHWALCLAGLPCLWLWPGAGGAVVAAAYAAGQRALHPGPTVQPPPARPARGRSGGRDERPRERRPSHEDAGVELQHRPGARLVRPGRQGAFRGSGLGVRG